MTFTFLTVEMAACLLQKCEQNLQIAVNVFLENSSSCTESTVSSNSCTAMEVDDSQDVDASQGPLVMTSSQCCNMESDIVPNNCGKSSRDGFPFGAGGGGGAGGGKPWPEGVLFFMNKAKIIGNKM